MDERKGHLLVTFRACAGLEVCHGILADMQDTGKSAAHMAQAIHKAVEIFCSPRREHPGTNPVLREPRPQDKADAAQAKQRILKRIEMVSADGASNGQVAARMMHPKVRRSCADVVELPFLKIVVIDKAHSSRRIPDRTFRHDPDMTTILNRVILDPDSVAHTLQYSEQLFGMFQKELRRQQRPSSCKMLSSDMRNFSFAKQRFDSLAKPLSRCVWNLDAVISTCEKIRDIRGLGNKQGKGCHAFLQMLSPLTVILMGMMADANEECLALTRFMDAAVLRVEGLSKQVADFTARVDLLFKENLCLKTGFTKVALEHLAQQKMIKLAENKYLMLGGSQPEAQREIARATRRALQKFHAWADLVHEVVQTEFPDLNCLPPSTCSSSTRAWKAPPIERHTQPGLQIGHSVAYRGLPTSLVCPRTH